MQGAPYDIEHRIVVAQSASSRSQLKWVRERAEVTFDASGKPLEGVGTVQDVTERRRPRSDYASSIAPTAR